MTQRPYILVSNDDGIEAPGLAALVDFLSPLADVVAVAPDGPRSGQSAAITVDAPLRIREHAPRGNARMFSVNGTPVDCIKLALHAVVDRRPDMVVAGINHGSNAGNSIIYSGTMGAVSEGCTVGIPSVGFSLLDHSLRADFSGCAATVERVTRHVLANGLPEGVCLNVNIPAGVEPLGIKAVRAARGYWTEEYADYTDPHGRPFYLLTGRFHNSEPDADDTDEFWLARNWSTVVPVALDQSAVGLLPALAF